MTGKELAKKGTAELAGYSDSDFGSVGHKQELASNDIMIPKLLVMQPQSPKVVDGTCKLGDVVDASSWEALGKARFGQEKGKPLDFIPFSWSKYWIIKRKDGKRFKTEKLLAVDRHNQNDDPWEQWKGADGVERQRVYLHLFYVIIPGKPFPYVLGFKGASKKHGDTIVTQMYVVNESIRGDAWKSSPMASMMRVTPTVVSKEDSTFVVLESSVLRPSKYEEACEALRWYKKVSAGKTKADLSVFGDDEVVNPHDNKGDF